MVYRIFVERKPGFQMQAEALQNDLNSFLNIKGLTAIRVFYRYDVEGIQESLFRQAVTAVFSEPQTDDTYASLPKEAMAADVVFAVEYLPGQFDQRADSAAQCIQLLSGGERPTVRTATVYALYGTLTNAEADAVKRYIINPVESREAALALPNTLQYQAETPKSVPVLSGFRALTERDIPAFLLEYRLAMDADDLLFCQKYFIEEGRDPTETELRVIDTYWSDHCRHTTFSTELTDITFDMPEAEAAYADYLNKRAELGRTGPVTLMDMATFGARYCKAKGLLPRLDESEEINACTVSVDVDVNGANEEWLLLFKNETHNHPTEIEPFGGAATCIGGAIRDPLSGRGYVYQAMRVTGCGDPLTPVENTLPGKLPQRKLSVTAAMGNSSYGNQIGLATGLVDELYHPGYMAKHMEIGAVIGAAPRKNVRRERPAPNDVVLLLGGRTGRDGCGGATGSSKSHNVDSLALCGAEVQKGNAPEERKLQRLFRDPAAARMIKRCNDFGAGGVCVAIGELADGLSIDLSAVPTKYEGLGGTVLAISESQERMAVVVDPKDEAAFCRLAAEENLEATPVAVVTEAPRLTMHWQNQSIVDLSRGFLDSHGAKKQAAAHVAAPKPAPASVAVGNTVQERMHALVSHLSVCSRQGLSERFDSTIGRSSLLMPFGGRRQKTPIQAMAAKLPVVSGDTSTCSVMSYGFDPCLCEADPYTGAYAAVREALCKLIATGGSRRASYFTFQEYFPRLGQKKERWGQPVAALLGALSAQLDYGVAAIGGKDSMSGSFESLDVPPTLTAFAVCTCHESRITSPEFKKVGSRVVLLAPGANAKAQCELFDGVEQLITEGAVLAAYAPSFGGIAEGLFKMCLGNGLGFKACGEIPPEKWFTPCRGGFILELAEGVVIPTGAVLLGHTESAFTLTLSGAAMSLAALEQAYEKTLSGVYPLQKNVSADVPVAYAYEAKRRVTPQVHVSHPRVLIPVFPGTNCEYDSARAMEECGAVPTVFVLQNGTPAAVEYSVQAFSEKLKNSQMLFLPGGFSAGDEPDGSGKFITAFLKSPRIREEIAALLDKRDGLILGICNGFQALVKLGLLPDGYIRNMDEASATLTYNAIGRHVSRLVRMRVASNKSPWLMYANVGDIHTAPVSHGEGRFVCSPAILQRLADNGQIATQYVDEAGQPTMNGAYNPNGSLEAIEGITSPDGRILGKMAHSERITDVLYRNVPGNNSWSLLQGGVDYFRR
ncbi:MAG: phosphoribosylformylglycinamidine synthase [Eubacteriales bacterium]|nr:phosphoribosylformylglycinamidine synthase [Eubacteriales bacterium]